MDERLTMEPAKADFYKRLEDTPEPELRHNIRNGLYTGRHKLWADQWITEIDLKIRELEREVETSAAAEASALNRAMATSAREAAEASRLQAEEAAEANRLAREANNIARTANRKADTANTVATIAAIIAVVSIAVAIISAFVNAH